MDLKRINITAKRVTDDGIIEFIGSTATPDRIGDIVEQDWDTKAYKLNPVVLYAHNHDGLPIAKTVSIGVVNGALHFVAQFVPAEIYPFAGVVRSLYEKGFLSAFSVGFRSIGARSASGVGYGERLEQSELLEVSAVPVPMNAEALLIERAADAPKVVAMYGKGDSSRTKAMQEAGRDDVAVKSWLSAQSVAPEGPSAPQAIDKTEERFAQVMAAIAGLSVAVAALTAKAAMEATSAVITPAPAAAPAATETTTATEPATQADALAEDQDEAAYTADEAALSALIVAERARLGGAKP